ncbi:MAG TPA: isochorismatase family cysteine hydrolase [Sedimentibacter sp.]|nr:cysteine hydrolase [Sedimentibacter sp.]HNZ82911.1 isochorismatase family cysteine hydrolase [Sedimentibacter sp.]HOH69372.1 isochorismatase family cysteine hydrolase [Sedimentibacter sp.]HQB63546.1 isochorismatase family cysteine hydrolase [Sedimentibacter sp.]
MEALKSIEEELKGREIRLSSLDKDRTALIVVDMVNGFVYSGPLASARVAAKVENIVELNRKMKGYKKMFFLDTHSDDSKEFCSFPVHCIKGDKEAELIPELMTQDSQGQETYYIEKNSTNGFHAEGFKEWINKYEDEVDNFIITGCVTDICVLQFSLTLKSYFNEKNKEKRIIVPANMVETYDGGSHDGNLINLISLYNMHTSGIEVVDGVI